MDLPVTDGAQYNDGIDHSHHEWREGSDPFNARQPGEVAKVPKSVWRTGTSSWFHIAPDSNHSHH
jgi:hypothetical protein